MMKRIALALSLLLAPLVAHADPMRVVEADYTQAPAANDYLRYNGTKWHPWPLPTGAPTNTPTSTPTPTNTPTPTSTSTPTATPTFAAGSSTGVMVKSAATTIITRTLTGTANQVVITNGDGVSGNPTFSLPQNIHTGATPQFAGVAFGGNSTFTASNTYDIGNSSSPNLLRALYAVNVLSTNNDLVLGTTSSHDTNIRYNGTNQWKFTGTTLEPIADNSEDIGTSSKQVKVAYINTISGLDAAGWSPTYSGSGSLTWTSVSTNAAQYFDMGGIVFFRLDASGTCGGSANSWLQATTPTTAASGRGYCWNNLNSNSGDWSIQSGLIAATRDVSGSNWPTSGTCRIICWGFYYE